MTTEYDAFADVYEYQYGQTTFDLDFYLAEAQAAQPPVLELACGTGRVTLTIAQAGVPIVGLDSSVEMLNNAREKAEGLGDLPVRWMQADMREFRLEERFGLIIIPARSFLHLLDPEDHVQALINIHQHLTPGGKLIMNFFVPNMMTIAEHTTSTQRMLAFQDELVHPDTGVRIAVWSSRKYDVHQQRIYQTYRYEQLDDDGFVVAARYRYMTLCYIWPREMKHLLARCGYEIEALYGWFDRNPFDAKSSEQIWVARRSR